MTPPDWLLWIAVIVALIRVVPYLFVLAGYLFVGLSFVVLVFIELVTPS